jgi:hypothetical protein
MEYRIRNRYNTEIAFNFLADNKTCIMDCSGASFLSCSQNEAGELQTIDPEGGPFLGTGFDLWAIILDKNELLKKDNKLVIKKLENDIEGIKITYEKFPIKSHQNHVKENSTKERK